jgi:hypothetical protein
MLVVSPRTSIVTEAAYLARCVAAWPAEWRGASWRMTVNPIASTRYLDIFCRTPK